MLRRLCNYVVIGGMLGVSVAYAGAGGGYLTAREPYSIQWQLLQLRGN